MDKLLTNLSHLMNHREQAGAEGFAELMGKIVGEDMGWELGPDLLSPATYRLSLSWWDVRALDMSPPLAEQLPLKGDGWIIAAGIPPRDWEMYFEATMNGKDLNIEGAEWWYAMADVDPDPDASVDHQVMLTIAPSSQFAGLTDEELEEFANIIVTGELGDVNVATFVRWIDVSSTRLASEEWFPMDSLRKKFAEKFPECEYSSWLATSR